MKKAKSASKKVSKLEEKIDEKLADFEKRVTKNGNCSNDLSKKISEVENKIASANSSLNNDSPPGGNGNALRLEAMARDLEQVKLEVAQLKLAKMSVKMDFKSDELNDWFCTKFHAFLEAPRGRKMINDTVETKICTHKVILKNFYKVRHRESGVVVWVG